MSWGYISALPNSTNPSVRWTLLEILNKFNETYKANFTLLKGNDFSEVQIFNQNDHCTIKTLDGQCGVMICYDLVLSQTKLFTIWFQLMEFFGKYGNYTKILLSHRATSFVAQSAIDYGFQPILSFKNKRTWSDIVLLIKDV
jgi:hypothetical protein